MWRNLTRAICALFALLMLAIPATAHFSEGTQMRTIILAQKDGALIVYVRTPLPLLFSDIVQNAEASETPLETPFLYLEQAGSVQRYRVALDAITTDETAFRDRLQTALTWMQNGHQISAELLRYRIVGRETGKSFNTPDDAVIALQGQGARLDPVFGIAIVEMELVLGASAFDTAIEVRATYPELPLAAGSSIDNHIIDARKETPVSYTIPGQLVEAATIDGSVLHIVSTFIWQGFLHIIEGIDHVFLVICLALGVGGSLKRLVGFVTAFTLGHSVTLVATFLGAAPEWPWFIPTVEAAIAASVLYASIAAVMKKMGSVWIIAAVGLLHGLGFSFVLGDILGRDAPNLVPALAAFNVGIELGQVAILAATLGMVFILSRLSDQIVQPARTITLSAIGLVAVYWVVERSILLV